ncbi:MAG: CapA family protein [Candidatus Merdivicinus sp.]|jgi:poly-gamma-glutamate capsule biosynthesis protein CapA/YwtB (metallophosphatase superfamily)
MKSAKFRIWPILILVMFCCSSCLFQPVGDDALQSNTGGSDIAAMLPISSESESSELVSSEPEIPEPVVIRLKAVGDNLIHSSIYEQANRRANGEGYDYQYAYEHVADMFSDADIASINQESIIAPAFGPSTYPMFNATPELGDLMLELGFDVFNLANNHCLDKGEKGVFSSLDYWAERPEAVTTGVYRNQEDYEKIRTMTAKGITFSFVGITELTNGLSLPQGSEAIVLLGSEEDKIEQRIKAAKEISEVCVVNIHWGNEYTHVPTERQRYLAQKLSEWGADIIIGHHPHVIQPIEYIDRADGSRTLVAYSLGNFISAQDRGVRMIGGMLDVDITKNFETDTISVTRCEFVPIITHYDRGFANNRLYPLSEYTEELANSHGVRAYSPEFSRDYILQTVRDVIDAEFLPNLS